MAPNLYSLYIGLLHVKCTMLDPFKVHIYFVVLELLERIKLVSTRKRHSDTQSGTIISVSQLGDSMKSF